tara:strand:- start:8526 stop:9239 length:714 start_codon:yes stop_codon:yes gene_type:complete
LKSNRINKYSQIDHSKTYKDFKFRNIPHILRLKKHINILKNLKNKSFNSYSDYGCSNGYITNIISKKINPKKTVGFDHSLNLELARKEYPEYEFKFFDLNIPNNNNEKFDLVTCFETLEHVGCIFNGIDNLINSLTKKGILIISVPIETGLIGFLKFSIKRIFYKDTYTLNKPELSYLKALLLNKDISGFRDPDQTHYGPHLGFDYRVIDRYLKKFSSINFQFFNSYTTRYYIVEKF